MRMTICLAIYGLALLEYDTLSSHWHLARLHFSNKEKKVTAQFVHISLLVVFLPRDFDWNFKKDEHRLTYYRIPLPLGKLVPAKMAW